jgi:hypothetical protein
VLEALDRPVVGEEPLAIAVRMGIVGFELFAHCGHSHVAQEHVRAKLPGEGEEVHRFVHHVWAALQQHLTTLVEAESPAIRRPVNGGIEGSAHGVQRARQTLRIVPQVSEQPAHTARV